MKTLTANPFENGTEQIYALPDEWFAQTPLLSDIHNYALSNGMAPTQLYADLLANAAAWIRPGILTPIGTEPNLFVGSVGRTGSGHSTVLTMAKILLPLPVPPFQLGTWQGFTEAVRNMQRAGTLASLPWRLDSTQSIWDHQFSYGAPAAEQFERMWDSREIIRSRGGLEAGTYRVTLHESIYPTSVSGWLFTPKAVALGWTTRFLFTRSGYHPTVPREQMKANPPEPTITIPDWASVPDGALKPPFASLPAIATLASESGTAVERSLLKLRFTVMVAHAALHGRTTLTDDDWNATELPMAVSRSICAKEFDLAQSVWNFTGRKPSRKGR